MEEIDLKIKDIDKQSVFETAKKIIRLINSSATLHVDPEFAILSIKGAGVISQAQEAITSLVHAGLVVEIPKRYDSCTRSPYCNCNPNG